MEHWEAKKQGVMFGIIVSGGVEIRDVDGGEEPFVYSSKNCGPGYVDIKGRVGFDHVFEPMVSLLADRLMADGVDFDLVIGMMTGGALPGYHLKQVMANRLRKRIVYAYQRGARKVGGHGELDTGVRNNPQVPPGIRTLVVEELVNFAVTTCNGVAYERSQGRTVTDAACILFYENPVAVARLEVNAINLHYAISLPELLHFGSNEGLLNPKFVKSYLKFLEDPKKWNEDRGFQFYATGE